MTLVEGLPTGGSASGNVVCMHVFNRSSGVRAYNCTRMDSNTSYLAGMDRGKAPAVASTIAPNYFDNIHTCLE